MAQLYRCGDCRKGETWSGVSVLAAWLLRRLFLGDAGKHDRFTIWKFRNKRERASHGLNALAQSGDHEIGALLEFGHTVLSDPQRFCHADLCQLTGLPQLLQGHLLGNELRRSGLNLLAAGRAKLLPYPFQIGHHRDFRPFFCFLIAASMCIEAVIGLLYQLAVETLLAAA